MNTHEGSQTLAWRSDKSQNAWDETSAFLPPASRSNSPAHISVHVHALACACACVHYSSAIWVSSCDHDSAGARGASAPHMDSIFLEPVFGSVVCQTRDVEQTERETHLDCSECGLNVLKEGDRIASKGGVKEERERESHTLPRQHGEKQNLSWAILLKDSVIRVTPLYCVTWGSVESYPRTLTNLHNLTSRFVTVP